MGTKTKIEWADSTINPIMGCTGCDLYPGHCYAATLCNQYAGRKGWPTSFDQPKFFPGRMEKALGWSDLTGKARPGKPWLVGYPRIIFINDLSDSFCPDVDPWQWLAPNIATMDLSPHVWLLLTKWPNRMRKFFEERVSPIPDNFWLGTSVCRQCDEWRIEELLRIQGAAIRFVSCEPLLGPIDLSKWIFIGPSNRGIGSGPIKTYSPLDWAIVGGESGPGARPMDPDWPRGIRYQCRASDAPFFFKQTGAWLHQSQTTAQQRGQMHNKVSRLPFHEWADGSHSWRVGKKYAGRLLNGRTWNEMPKAWGLE